MTTLLKITKKTKIFVLMFFVLMYVYYNGILKHNFDFTKQQYEGEK